MKSGEKSGGWLAVPVFGAAALSVCMLSAAPITGTSQAIAVDTSAGAMFVAGRSTIATMCYGARVAGLEEGVDHVVIRRYREDGPGEETLVDEQTLSGLSQDIVTGGFQISSDAGGFYQRWTHTAYDSGNHEIGQTQSARFSLAAVSAASLETDVDTRTNSLELAVQAGGPLPLVYSRAWATNGEPASVTISFDDLESTSTVFTERSAAEGVHLQNVTDPLRTGVYTYYLTIRNIDEEVLEQYSASYFMKRHCGFLFIIR